MNFITDSLIKLGLLKKDLDYHLIRIALVLIFLFFRYQKWFEYEAAITGAAAVRITSITNAVLTSCLSQNPITTSKSYDFRDWRCRAMQEI
jgi:uncharacterized membrane protein YkgB